MNALSSKAIQKSLKLNHTKVFGIIDDWGDVRGIIYQVQVLMVGLLFLRFIFERGENLFYGEPSHPCD